MSSGRGSLPPVMLCFVYWKALFARALQTALCFSKSLSNFLSSRSFILDSVRATDVTIQRYKSNAIVPYNPVEIKLARKNHRHHSNSHILPTSHSTQNPAHASE